MRQILLLLVTLAAWSVSPMSAQPYRYLEPVFDDVLVSSGIPYAVNATVLYAPVTGEAVPEVLSLDLYEPSGDPDAERPLIIYFHSGNFLPHPQNTSPQGLRTDSSTVSMCRFLARTGYVVASADYRLGWNPLAGDQFDRLYGIINAAYRGVQDAKTCVRFFKRTVVEEGNPYRIDTSRIILWGEDTGGYLAANASALDRWEKISWNPQFFIAPGIYMVMEYLNGDPEGKQFGINDPPLLPFPVGDTLCYPNHTAYSSAFRVAVNLGGAVADTSWLESGSPPVISIQTPYDETTPYGCGLVVIRTPVGDLPIIDVCGASAIATKGNALGTLQGTDPGEYLVEHQWNVAQVAQARANGLSGLFPIYGDTLTDSAPWEFWSPSNPNHSIGLMTNPTMSKSKALACQDSIMAFVLPRLYEYCRLAAGDAGLAEQMGLVAYPNPASDVIYLLHDPEYTLQHLLLYDLQGRLLRAFRGDATAFDIPDLPAGHYLLNAVFDKGVSARIIAVE